MLKLHALDVNVVDDDLSFDDFNDSGERKADCALASTCAANYSDFFSGQGSEAKVVKDYISVWSILQRDILELNLTLRWPVGISTLERVER